MFNWVLATIIPLDSPKPHPQILVSSQWPKRFFCHHTASTVAGGWMLLTRKKTCGTCGMDRLLGYEPRDTNWPCVVIQFGGPPNHKWNVFLAQSSGSECLGPRICFKQPVRSELYLWKTHGPWWLWCLCCTLFWGYFLPSRWYEKSRFLVGLPSRATTKKRASLNYQ